MVELTKKCQVFRWTEDCQKAFDALKEALLGPEIMAYPMEQGRYILDTDACGRRHAFAGSKWHATGHCIWLQSLVQIRELLCDGQGPTSSETFH